VGRRLATISHGIFGAADLAASAASDPTAAPWIALDDSLAGTMAARWIRKHVSDERVVLRANSLSVLGALAEAGVGLTVLPCFMARAWPGLVRVGAPLEGWDTTLWLLTHEDLRTTARVRALLDFLATAFADERDRLAGRD
jgi:DNA-binding transcriptional LysR family regulator